MGMMRREGVCVGGGVQTALTKEVALIQGPPGTGKTYLGIQLIRLLVRNGVKGILVECLTNHAIDQLMQGLEDAGVDSLVRIGSR